MSNHTPGKWWFAQHDEFGRYDIGQGDSAIARTIAPADSGPGSAPITNYHHDQQRANARLIAAAPDLLDALKALIGCAEPHRDRVKIKAARAAITKAIGA